MSNGAAFDVFLSYKRSDTAAVERLARALRERGLKVFLDRDYLTAGQPWPELLEKHLRGCGAVAVCLGPSGLGPWQQREQYVALDRQAKESGFPVIPVLLPGAKDPPLGFLRLNSWIDVTASPDDPAGIELLIRAIEGKPSAPDEVGRPDPRAAICPYRGLKPFREEDETFFVGREAFTTTLIQKVAQSPVVGVVGASGAGKSSVVLAGLVPALRRGAGGQVWDIGVMRPGEHPLRQLAATFLPPDQALDEFDRLATLRRRAEQFASGEVTLADIVTRTLETQPGTERLLLVVDQWEELYTQVNDSAERANFLRILLDGVGQAPLSLVLTLRGDFYGQTLGDRALADRLQDRIVNIGPMGRSELERAIVEPGTKVGLSFEEALVGYILDEVGDEPGNLPLLEFLLTELWARRERGGRLSFGAYHETGGVKKAIAARAENELKKLTPDQQAAARRFLIRLVTPGEGREDTRARVPIPRDDPEVRAVVQHLSDARLVTTGWDPASGREIVEVSHEVLIREWGTLKAWVDEDREFLRTVERVKSAMRHWEERGRSEDLLLPPGRPLEEARDLLAQGGEADIEDIEPYIEISIQREDERRATEEDRRRRELENAMALAQSRRRQARIALVFSAVVALVAIVAGWQWYERGVREDEARAAQRQADQERTVALARQLAAQSELIRGTNPALLERSALLAIEGMRRFPSLETDQALRHTLALLPRPIAKLNDETGTIISAAFSPGGRYIATANSDGTIRLRETATGQEIARFGHGQAASVLIYPDGDYLTVSSRGDAGAVTVWDVKQGRQLARFETSEGAELTDLSADGRHAVVIGPGDVVRVVNVIEGREVNRFATAGPRTYRGVSPDAKYLALGEVGGGNVAIREVDTGRKAATVEHTGIAPYRTVLFSSDGRTVATAGGSDVALWTADAGRKIRTLPHDEDAVSIQFSPSGELLATATFANQVRVWHVTRGYELARIAHVSYRSTRSSPTLLFSGDSRYLATTGDDQTVRILDLKDGREVGRVALHEGRSRTLAFSSNGEYIAVPGDGATALIFAVGDAGDSIRIKQFYGVTDVAFGPDEDENSLATAEQHRFARIWNLSTRSEVKSLDHNFRVEAVAFSPIGKYVATGAIGGEAILWDVATGKEIRRLAHPGGVWSLAFSHDGRYLATAAHDSDEFNRTNFEAGTARVWEVESGSQLTEVRHRGSVRDLSFSRDGRLLATASDDGSAVVWEVTTGRELARFDDHRQAVQAVAFSPDGSRLATASSDRTARLWDLDSGRELTRLRHEEEVNAVAFSPDGSHLATASSDRTARLWETGTGRQLAQMMMAGIVRSVTFSPSGRYVATGDETGEVRVWLWRPEDLIEETCRRLARNLTDEEWRQYVGEEPHRPTCQSLAFKPIVQ